MNPSLKFILVLIIALEVSFTNSIVGNVILIVVGLLYLLVKRVKLKRLLWILLIAVIPAIGLLISQVLYAKSSHAGILLFTRIYVYVIYGAAFTLTTKLYELVNSLEQNLHLPSKFVYGVMAVFNLLPEIQAEVNKIKTASLMRGVKLHWWSPTLYFRAILSAIRWSENLAQGMESHGFVEGQSRTFYEPVKITMVDWLVFVFNVILLQAILLLL
ncbi:energy-coupling factor transporter transmembrane component T family protein [Fructilactobacillus fructivorans]|uniref:energy-coupling factor transporter transmembrane component T family protein n=1 Tax=Fructilactobacillus fructivorans TaxID=1614 RepID=UPI0007050A11|nr:energy-coupling factor transporter transmembrane component T [Fructilactobacillus fructivorans]KRN42776.1 ABC transporter integral membrane subunit [Fructilactobacillus fructivorans]